MEKEKSRTVQDHAQRSVKSTSLRDGKEASATERSVSRGDGESAVLAKIAEMPDPYREMGSRIHAIIRANAPSLTPKVWYGMPGYAKDGRVLCFFRSGQKFEERYMTLGFNDVARLDDGRMWPIAYALTELTVEEEEKIAALVRKAVE